MIIFVSAKSPICRWYLLYFHFISSLLISLVSLRYLIWPLLNLHRYTRLGTFAWALNVSKGASHHLSSKYKRVEISRFQKAFLKFEQKQTSIIYFLILFWVEAISWSRKISLSPFCWKNDLKDLLNPIDHFSFRTKDRKVPHLKHFIQWAKRARESTAKFDFPRLPLTLTSGQSYKAVYDCNLRPWSRNMGNFLVSTTLES